MPVYFRHSSQVVSRVDYAKITKAALARKNEEEPFVSFEKFEFSDETVGPLVVFGELPSSVLADLKKVGKGLALGTCLRPDGGTRLTFRHTKGKPTYKSLRD